MFISRGFCYLTFAKAPDALRALSQESHWVGGRWVDVKKSFPPRSEAAAFAEQSKSSSKAKGKSSGGTQTPKPALDKPIDKATKPAVSAGVVPVGGSGSSAVGG